MQGQSNRLRRSCEICGKEFSAAPYEVRRGGAKFCGRACMGLARRVPLVERFWAKVDKDGPIPEHRPELGPCWLWTASVNEDGYGRIGVDGRNTSAHRLSYEWAKGPIPPGLEPDHLCQVRRCIRPDHLEAVTHRENVLRGNGPSAVARRTNTCPRGHVFTPESTYVSPDGKRRTCRTCQRRHPRVNKRSGVCVDCGQPCARRSPRCRPCWILSHHRSP